MYCSHCAAVPLDGAELMSCRGTSRTGNEVLRLAIKEWGANVGEDEFSIVVGASELRTGANMLWSAWAAARSTICWALGWQIVDSLHLMMLIPLSQLMLRGWR